MAVTGKTGADAWYRTLQKQAAIYKAYGPKLIAVVQVMRTAGLLDEAEYTALINGFNAVPAILSAIAKVAEYSGLW